MNRTNSKSARASKAAEHHRIPRRWRVGYGRTNISQVLECAVAAAVWISREVHGPNACEKAKGAFHEPQREFAGTLAAVLPVRGSWSECAA